MAVRSTNTMIEALQRLLQDIGKMKTLADADMPWLVELESMVLTKIREPLDNMQQSGQLPPPPMDPGMMPPDPAMMQGMGAGEMQGGGMMAGPQMPNPDELGRLLGAGGP